MGRKRRNILGDGKEGTEQKDDQLLGGWRMSRWTRNPSMYRCASEIYLVSGKPRPGAGRKHAQRVLSCIFFFFFDFSIHVKDVDMNEWREE